MSPAAFESDPRTPLGPAGTRLADLDPRYVTQDGKRVGVSLICPRCGEHRISTTRHDMSGATFATLTVTPSIVIARDGDPEHWHGFITNGLVTP